MKSTLALLVTTIMVLCQAVVAQEVFEWQKDVNNPVIAGMYSNVVRVGDTLHMFYDPGSAPQRINYAISGDDGQSWNDLGTAINAADPGLGFSDVSTGCVRYENGILHLYYTACQGASWNVIASSISADGIVWQDHRVILTLGADGSWDDYMIGTPKVVRTPAGDLAMVYLGAEGHHSPNGYGLAYYNETTELWEKHPDNPVVIPGGGPDDLDDHALYHIGSVCVRNELYYMFYTGFDLDYNAPGKRDIGYATSPDLLTWTKHGRVFSATDNQPWENGELAYPQVLFEPDCFMMFYNGVESPGAQIGRAVSAHATLCESVTDWRQPLEADDCTIGLWHFDQDSGDFAPDMSLFHHDGQLQNASWCVGRFGSGLSCSGVGYTSIPSTSTMYDNEQLTIEGWFSIESYGHDFWNYLLQKGLSYTVFVVDDDEPFANRLWAQIRTTDGIFQVLSPGPLTLDRWYHMAVVYDGTELSLYIDGDLRAASPASGTIIPSTEPLYIGANNVGATTEKAIHGQMDEVRISNTARSYTCCFGVRGNIQLVPACNDADQGVDVGDLTHLIDHLFIGFTPLCCDDEADISPAISGGTPDKMVDVGDLTALIDHLFITFPDLPVCD